MRYCPECGEEIKGTPKFCPECGTKFTIPTTSEQESLKISKTQHGMELLFDDEIDIDATATQLFELHYANVWKPYKTKIQVFEKQKSYEEIKASFKKQLQNIDVIRLILSYLLCGFTIGLLFGSLVSGTLFVYAIISLVIFIIFYASFLLEIQAKRKWVYFPTPKKASFVGNFTREDIKVFNKLIVFKKSIEKNEIEDLSKGQ